MAGGNRFDDEPLPTTRPPQGLYGDESQTLSQDITPPAIFIGEGLGPPAGHVPLVHGTPQVGQVPAVQGTPSIPQTPRPELPHHAPQTPPPHYPQQLLYHQPPPQFSPQPMPAAPEHGGPPYRSPFEQPHHHQPEQTHHAHQPRGQRRAKTGAGMKGKRVIQAVVATIVVVAIGIVILLLLNPPALALSGSGTLFSGGTLRLHGKGFLPGGHVTFTLDNGSPVSLLKHDSARAIPYSAYRSASSASVLLLLPPERGVAQAAADATVSVSLTGTFDATITVSTSWAAGMHIIHATESPGSRSAKLAFRVLPLPELLLQQQQFSPKSSDCLTITGSGNLIRGWLCTETLSSNAGDISWSASSTNPADEFTPSHGVVHANQTESVTIFIPADPQCANATFTFKGRGNSASVSWNCPAR